MDKLLALVLLSAALRLRPSTAIDCSTPNIVMSAESNWICSNAIHIILEMINVGQKGKLNFHNSKFTAEQKRTAAQGEPAIEIKFDFQLDILDNYEWNTPTAELTLGKSTVRMNMVLRYEHKKQCAVLASGDKLSWTEYVMSPFRKPTRVVGQVPCAWNVTKLDAQELPFIVHSSQIKQRVSAMQLKMLDAFGFTKAEAFVNHVTMLSNQASDPEAGRIAKILRQVIESQISSNLAWTLNSWDWAFEADKEALNDYDLIMLGKGAGKNSILQITSN